MTASGVRARLLQNVTPGRGHWLEVRAIDPALKRDAYGAELHVKTGGKEYLRLASPAESYLCSSSPVVHFGLGRAEKVDSILVSWPDGSKEEFQGGPADRAIVLRKGEGHKP